MSAYRPTRFVVNGVDTEFPGFTSGELWNGWACPAFTRQIAEQILIASESNGYHWRYNPATNAFEVWHEDDPEDYEPQIFDAMAVNPEDGSCVEIYAIGACSWTWTGVGQFL